jgi:DNA (cytosine-5)-methyltransferase 1
MSTIRYFDTFTGIGGFTKAIQDIIPDSECIGYSEIDKYASQIYEKHYPSHKNYGDITKLNTSNLPAFDLLVGGFPCQSFSVAGKRAGFNDTRGTLFFDLARILKDKRPRHFIFENVKGLLSHDSGKTIQTIFKVLTNIGYEYQWQVLNSKNFGVPQNRERIFIVGHLRGECRPKVFPITGSNTATLKEYTREQSQGNRIYSTEGISTTLQSLAGGLGAKTGLYMVDGVTINRGNLQKRSDSTCLDANYYKGLDNHAQKTGIIAQRGRYKEDGTTEQKLEPRKDEITNTITSVQKDNLLLQQSSIRKLTPTECERLQGFPDSWTEYGINEKCQTVKISDTQRYKCLGNAVTVNVVKEIISKLCQR